QHDPGDQADGWGGNHRDPPSWLYSLMVCRIIPVKAARVLWLASEARTVLHQSLLHILESRDFDVMNHQQHPTAQDTPDIEVGLRLGQSQLMHSVSYSHSRVMTCPVTRHRSAYDGVRITVRASQRECFECSLKLPLIFKQSTNCLDPHIRLRRMAANSSTCYQ